MPDNPGDEAPLKAWAQQVRADAARDRLERVTGRHLLALAPGTLRDSNTAARRDWSCHHRLRSSTHPDEGCAIQLTTGAVDRHRFLLRERWAKCILATAPDDNPDGA